MNHKAVIKGTVTYALSLPPVLTFLIRMSVISMVHLLTSFAPRAHIV